jgi:hypothetical protein
MEAGDDPSRLTINDFINDAPDGRDISIDDKIRGISNWKGDTHRGTNIRISSKIFSQARNFRMNQIYKYEENTNYHFYNSFNYQTIFIEKMMEEGTEKLKNTDEMLRFIPEDEEMFHHYGKDNKQKQRLIYYS